MVALFVMTKATFWRLWNTKTHRLAQHQLREINTGVLASRASLLKDWLSRIQNNNAQSEYYLPDVLALAKSDGIAVVSGGL